MQHNTSVSIPEMLNDIVIRHAARIHIDLAPVAEECSTAKIQMCKISDNPNVMTLSFPLFDPTLQEAVSESLRNFSPGTFAISQVKTIPVVSISQPIERYPSVKVVSPAAVSVHLEKREGRSLLEIFAAAFSAGHQKDLALPQSERPLLSGAECIVLNSPPANAEIMASHTALLYISNAHASLVIPVSVIPGTERLEFDRIWNDFVMNEDADEIEISMKRRSAMQIQLPEENYEDLLLLARQLKLNIVSDPAISL